MAPRQTRRARGGSVEAFVANVNQLVAENERLQAQNRRLLATLRRMGAMAAEAEVVPRGARGRRASAGTTTRRKITDPTVLERRRAALEKARQVRAANRTAQAAAAS